MIAAAFSRVTERLLVTDPGLVRLHNALRVALAVLFTGFLSIAWTVFHHQPVTLAAPGILFAMVAPLFVRDTRRVAWFGTLFSLYLTACACFAAASLLAPFPLAGDAGFLVVMFTGMLCQACGPRALGCAMLGVVCFYLGLYLHPTTLHLVQALMLSVIAPAMVTLVGRVLVPARVAVGFRLAVHTVTLRAARVLHTPNAAHLSALNEVALSLEEQLALLNRPDTDTIRERIVEVEVAAGQHAFASSPKGDSADALRHAMARLKETAHRRDMPQIEGAVTATRDASSAAQEFAHPLVHRFTQRVSLQLADLRGKLCWLPAARATTAAFLAMLIGHSLSPERWFWAVITTFVVFLGTRSRADTVYRGAQRLAGTLAGALVSVLLVAPLHHSPALLVAAMILCVFGWAYYILSAYAPGVFFITVLVGLVYGELGFAMGPLVELRIEEVVVGCVVSFAVAILMMPLAATRHVETRLGAVLAALRDVVRASGSTSDTDNVAAPAAMRKLDRTWHDLRIALRPLQTQRVVVWNPGVELATASLLCCLHWARVMSEPAQRDGPADAALHGTALNAAHLQSIVARLDSLIARYGADVIPAARGGLTVRDTAVAIDAAHSSALVQLDGAVEQLFERLTRPVGDSRRVLGWGLPGRGV